MQEACGDRLSAAGYRNYEISAWARPGRECRHNLNYWRFGDYLGIGAGASGKITLPADDSVLRTRRRMIPPLLPRLPPNLPSLTVTSRPNESDSISPILGAGAT